MRDRLVIVFLISILSFFVSCQQTEESLPEGLISKDNFIEMLVDIQLFEAINHVKREKGQVEFNLDQAYEWLFEKYNTSRENFQTSFDYYARDTKGFEEMYDEVIIRISQREAEGI